MGKFYKDMYSYIELRLPQELKNQIYNFIPMDERIKIILNGDFKQQLLKSYKWGRDTPNIYSDYSSLVNKMRIKSSLPKLKKTTYHDGYTDRTSKHPLMNLIESDFTYKKENNTITPLMFGFDRNWNAGGRGALVVTEDHWNILPENDFLRRRHTNYKGYISNVRHRITNSSHTALDLIIKYLKVKSYNNSWDYKLHKIMFNAYLSFASSPIMKTYIKGYEEYRRELEEKKLIRMEKYNAAREMKLMVREERAMKRIVRIEKKAKKEQDRLNKIQILQEKRELRLMEKEEKLMNKIVLKENREKKKREALEAKKKKS